MDSFTIITPTGEYAITSREHLGQVTAADEFLRDDIADQLIRIWEYCHAPHPWNQWERVRIEGRDAGTLGAVLFLSIDDMNMVRVPLAPAPSRVDLDEYERFWAELVALVAPVRPYATIDNYYADYCMYINFALGEYRVGSELIVSDAKASVIGLFEDNFYLSSDPTYYDRESYKARLLELIRKSPTYQAAVDAQQLIAERGELAGLLGAMLQREGLLPRGELCKDLQLLYDSLRLTPDSRDVTHLADDFIAKSK